MLIPHIQAKILSQLVMVGSLLGANPGFDVLNVLLIAGEQSPNVLIADIRWVRSPASHKFPLPRNGLHLGQVSFHNMENKGNLKNLDMYVAHSTDTQQPFSNSHQLFSFAQLVIKSCLSGA